jgi:hypothetical protein
MRRAPVRPSGEEPSRPAFDPRVDRPPRPRWKDALDQSVLTVGSLAGLVGLAWLLAPGGFHGGWFWWAFGGLLLAPVVLGGLFALAGWWWMSPRAGREGRDR